MPEDVIRSVKDLDRIKANVAALLEARKSDATVPSDGRYHVMLCFGTGCISSGASAVKKALASELEKRQLTGKVSLVETGCNGFCAGGPIVVVYPGGFFYHKVSENDAAEIVSEHLVAHRPVERLMFRNPSTGAVIPQYEKIEFFARQNARVLHNKGRIAAESIEEYIGRDGYFALAKALVDMTPEKIIEEVKASGLRGRGGAGFSTGLKWEFCRKAAGDMKYVLCNADEGDPGAFMDRSLIESDPHAVLEGMIIAARAIGASHGYIYCRAEYPLALHRLRCGIDACRRLGLLGKNILGSGFSFDLTIAQGSGAFVCGEETALMRSIEGKRGEPSPRPPFPANKGLFGKPSVLNNVETFGNAPLIILNGAAWYCGVGTEKSPGTKIFALTGKVNNVGLVEVNMGTPLGDIIYEIGGGIPGGKKFKAAQIGGPSGGCIPKEHLNTPVDYEAVAELGAIMGSGGLIVMDEDSCMVDMARFFLEFVQEESCGKCVPCRVGTKRMLEILERICAGQGQEGDVEKLIKLGNHIKETSLCGLGQTAPNPVLSTIRHFRKEYDQHIREKHCEAGVCPSLVRAPCQSACPAGVDVPGFVSLVGEKRYAEALKLHRERNPFAAVCARVCFHTCEDKCRRTSIDASVSIRGVKRFMVDQEIIMQIPEIRHNEKNSAKKIAIIGGGPAGLACAYFLARLGYRPTVFEAEPRPGGMLVQTIPAYRLPRETLAREIRMIEQIGVTIETNAQMGRDFSLQSLRDKKYDAIFIGIGAPGSFSVGVPGEDADGVVMAVPFLKQYNIRGAAPVGKKVVVVGGGNAAIDAARTALRLGAEFVTVLYRRSRDEMPAYAEEVSEAVYEGVKLMPLTHPTEFLKGPDGKVTGVRCMTMKLGDYDRTGRRRPTVDGANQFDLEADQVIVAIGQTLNAGRLFDLKDAKLEMTANGFIKTDPVTGQTSVPGIFAGGDVATGPWSVVAAIGAGETAAVGIDKFLTGEDHAFWRDEKVVDTDYDPDMDPVPFPREPVFSIPVEKRKHNFEEVELAWNETVTQRQAKRCLRCDYGKAVKRRGK